MFDCVQTHSISSWTALSTLQLDFFFCFFCFLPAGRGERTQQVQKTHLTSRFLSYNPPRKTHTHSLSHTQTQLHIEIKACQKETDLSRLTQVQMSQCGWISFGIVSAPSFDKEVFLSARRDMTVSSGLRSPRQHSGFCRRGHRWTHLAETHAQIERENERFSDRVHNGLPSCIQECMETCWPICYLNMWTLELHTHTHIVITVYSLISCMLLFAINIFLIYGRSCSSSHTPLKEHWNYKNTHILTTLKLHRATCWQSLNPSAIVWWRSGGNGQCFRASGAASRYPENRYVGQDGEFWDGIFSNGDPLLLLSTWTVCLHATKAFPNMIGQYCSGYNCNLERFRYYNLVPCL